MAENNEAQQPQPQPLQQQFGIQTLYVKDISFETPMGPALFQKQWQPKFGVELNTSSKKFQENSYEVVLSVTVTAKLEEEVAALVEVHQAGLFLVTGFEGEQLRQALGIFAPNILFPYVREAIDSICNRGGIPPMKLQPVNFEALYHNAVKEAQRQQEQQQQAATDAH